MYKVALVMTFVFHVFLGKSFLLGLLFTWGSFFTHLISFKSLTVQGLLCILAVGLVLVLKAKSKDIKYYIC